MGMKISNEYGIMMKKMPIHSDMGCCSLQYDFTGCGIYLFVAAMVLFIFGIIAIFTYSRILYTLYSAGIALLFSMVGVAANSDWCLGKESKR